MAIQWLDPYIWFVTSLAMFMLGLLGISPLNYDFKIDGKLHLQDIFIVYCRRFFLICIPLDIVIIPLVIWSYWATAANLSLQAGLIAGLVWYTQQLDYCWWPLGWWLVGWLLRIYCRRYLAPVISNLHRKLRITQNVDELSDIRHEKNRYAAKQFLPESYYCNQQMLFGLDENYQPVYITQADWQQMNLQVLGPTRSGKGVLLGNLVDQAILNDCTVFFIDPKGDKFVPKIMANRAKQVGKNFFYYDLSDTALAKKSGAWSPFVGGELRARRARLLGACGLHDTGGDADFYKQKEKNLLDYLLQKTDGRLPLLIEEFKNNPQYQIQGQRIYNTLLQWSKLSSLCPPKNRGLSIEKSLLNNAIVYIKGALDDEIIREAMRILIMEIVQEIKRLALLRASHTTLFIDEVRFLISNPLVDALATIAAFNANIVLAYQAKNDVKNVVDKNLDGNAIAQSINMNCQLKFFYGSLDPETNRWVEAMSGQSIKTIMRLEQTNIGHFGEETWGKSRTMMAEKEACVTENALLSLPNRVGVLLQPGSLAKIVFTAFVPVSAGKHPHVVD